MDLKITPLTYKDFKRLHDFNAALGKHEQDDYFVYQFEHQKDGTRDVYMAALDGMDAGYCVFNRTPKYVPFKKLKIPEIQDLNVLPNFRRRGIGRAIIEHCENQAATEGFMEMGIGVGVLASYGSAQRLYVKMGYIPDGLGMNHDRKQIAAGEFRPIDDDLSLMMVKNLI